MALPSSGQISLNDINLELGRTSGTQISLDDAENGTYATINPYSCKRPSSTNPASVSEWHGYDHNAIQAKNRFVYAKLEADLTTQNWDIYYGTTALATSIGSTAKTCIQRGTAITVNDGDSLTFYVKNSSSGVNVAFYGSNGTAASCPTGGTLVDSYTVTFDACNLYVGITVRVSSGSLVVL